MKIDVELIATPGLYDLAQEKGFKVQPAMWDTWEVKNKEDFIQKAKEYDKKDEGYVVFRCCISDEDLESFHQSNNQP